MFSHFDMEIRWLHQQVVSLSRPLIGESAFGACYHGVDVVMSNLNVLDVSYVNVVQVTCGREIPKGQFRLSLVLASYPTLHHYPLLLA